MGHKVAIRVEQGDALVVSTDVLVLKYAQASYGIDGVVTRRFLDVGRPLTLPKPGECLLKDSPEGIAALHVMFVGVPPSREFGYPEIRAFARRALSVLSGAMPAARHVAMTVTGHRH